MRQLRACAAAFSFMTRIPASSVVTHDASDLALSVAYFPAVGLVVGLIAALVYAFASVLWSPLIAVLLSTVATVRTTGAFHEDALADSLDGFGGGWTKEQVLSIMKDSRVGSYALVGTFLVLALKVAALTSIATDAAHDALTSSSTMARLTASLPVASALIAAHMIGRCSSVLLLYVAPYVRAPVSAEKPASGVAFENVTPTRLLVAVVSTAIVVTLLFRFDAVVLLAVAFTITLVALRYFRRRIGGVTGDALGAANQIVELSAYLAIAAHPIHSMSLR